MLKQLKSLFDSYKQYNIDDKKKMSLDIILSSANSAENLELRLEWIQKLFKWIRSDIFQTKDERIPVIKIKYLLMILERNPLWKAEVSQILQRSLNELSSVDFFCEVGLPGQIGFIGELSEKLMAKILPQKTINNQLGELILILFPDILDSEWMKAIDVSTLEKIFQLFQSEDQKVFPHLESDTEEALIYLVSQSVAIGLSPLIRKRIPHAKMKTLPFFTLAAKLNLYLKTKNEHQSKDLNDEIYRELQTLLVESEKSIVEVYSHLDKFGVSIQLVYQLERLKQFLSRTILLLQIHHDVHLDQRKIVLFTADLIGQSQLHASISSLISGNLTLLAQKIVERNSRTGEHYIAQDAKEYSHMFVSAAGGGFVTAFTVYIKTLILTFPLTPFFAGALASLNYTLSFLVIHFAGFTLATKQPASTAPALARKLEELEKIEQLESITDEIVLVARTQSIAVIGNLLAVFPSVLIINLIYYAFTKRWIVDFQTAEHNLHSTDLIGPAMLFAAFTGILLWLSSLAAGWAENWFAFNNLHHLLLNNKKANLILGKAGAKKLASFLENNISGIAANFSLGILLGLVPVFLAFLGIPIEVRHVTLSTGAIAAALPTLGFGIMKSLLFWRCIAGLMAVGFINIFVSFSMAFFVAVRAKKISARKRRLIYRSVWKRFAQKPISFLIPS